MAISNWPPLFRKFKIRRSDAETAPLIFVNTIPKSGTHLLLKMFELAGCVPLRGITINSHIGDFWPYVDHEEIIDDEGNFRTDAIYFGGSWATEVDPERAYNLINETFSFKTGRALLGGHLLFHPHLRDLVRPHKPRMVVVLRDPRAVAVSHASWVMHSPGHPLESYYRNLSMPERVTSSFSGISPNFSLNINAGKLPLARTYKNMVRWLKEPYVRAVRFEDFLPSSPHLRNSVADILSWCEVPFDGELLQKIETNLFGGTATFRKGTADSWIEFSDVFSSPELASQVDEILALLGDLNLEPESYVSPPQQV